MRGTSPSINPTATWTCRNRLGDDEEQQTSPFRAGGVRCTYGPLNAVESMVHLSFIKSLTG